MGKVFLVNAGSSSVKWKLFEASDESVIAKGLVERINMPGSVFEVKYGSDKYEIKINNLSYEKTAELIFEKLQELKIISDLAEIEAVGHRIVAGGEQFKSAVELTEDNLNKLSKMNDFAPLHNPMEIKYVKIMQHTLPEIPQYAVFDSQFFTDLPEKMLFLVFHINTRKNLELEDMVNTELAMNIFHIVQQIYWINRLSR